MALTLLLPASAHSFGPVSAFGPTGSTAGKLSVPVALAVAPSGLVYVSELQNFRVSVFTPEGAFVRAFGKSVNPAGGDVCTAATGCRAGTASTEGGSLYAPIGIAFGPGEEVFVANGAGYRMDVFSADGTFLRAFAKGAGQGGGDLCTVAPQCQAGQATGAAGTLLGPIGVEVDPTGNVYVTTANQRIDMFTAAGAFLGAFGKAVNPSGGDFCTTATGCKSGTNGAAAGAMSGPFDIALGPEGQIAVTAANNNRVDVFSPAGQFLYAFGQGVSLAGDPSAIGTCTAATGCRKGTASGAAGSLSQPGGIAVNDAGNLIVAEFNNSRMSEFTFAGTFIRAFGEGVLDGGQSFQVCTAASGCRAGISSERPGALGRPYGAAFDCRGGIYSTMIPEATSPALAKRFGAPGLGLPPCPPPASATNGGTGFSPSGSSLSPTASRKSAKPMLEVELNPGSGTATLVVIVSDPGALLLKGKGIRKVRKKAPRPGLYELPLVSKGAANRKLLRTGKTKIKLLLTFKPQGDVASTQSKVVTLKRLVRF